ncbi:DUF6177 family protein [Curtobacterium sp. PhB115]|uniref:DUF6177 family protein n=1 Tax=Curtobacterium sp. PhB115 TaxID=2485173 RepID=UPI000F4BD55C|nr:DUF6177 family protein [Curtobacterium sp. PhB115]ROP74891.1 hypothetical protein EDF19_0979 [Curtobacterium sp. PhB115]
MVRHPLIDDVVGPAIVVESASPVVWLTEALASLLRRSAAAGRMVVLRTGRESAVTPALRHALGAYGAAWAVADFDGTLRDGRTGVAASGIEDFVHRGPELVGTPSPEHPVSADSVRQISIDLTLRHHAERAIDMGSAIEALCHTVGTCPTRWGTAEPLAVPWDRWVVTQYAKHEAPGVSTSYAVGEGFSATMTAHLVDRVVVETMAAVLTVPEENTDPELANRLFDAVQQVADEVVPVFGVVMQRRGDADHLVRAVSHGEPSPLAVVVGPEASGFLDRDGVWPPPRTTTATFGARRAAGAGASDTDGSGADGGDAGDSGMIVRFEDGWEALESFLDRIDEDRFLELVGGAPLDPAHDEGTLDGHVRVAGGQGAA